MPVKIWGCLLALLVFAAGAAMAAGDPVAADDLFPGFRDDAIGDPATAEDLFSGFGDDAAGADPFALEFDSATGTEGSPTASGGSRIMPRLSGYAKLGTTYNYAHSAPRPGETDWRGLSRLRGELQLEAEYRLRGWTVFASGKGWYDLAYGLNGRSEYTTSVLDAYEQELELREAYLWGTLSESLDVKVGRQIVVWGRSDNFRVTDTLNPLDNREPGLTDIEDLRLPLAMTRFSWFAGDWTLGVLAIHEHRFDKRTPFGHDFFPAPAPGPPEIKPAHSLDNTEGAAELKGVFSGWDISFYGASVFDDQGSFDPGTPVTLRHRRIAMAGTALSVARGNFLFLLEAAHLRGLRFMSDPGQDYQRTDLLAGVEYTGFTETTLSLDILNRHLHGFGGIPERSPEYPRRNDSQAAFRYTRDFMNDRLALTALLIAMGDRAQYGALQRYTANYEIADGWEAMVGVALYHSGRGAMASAGDNDRVFTELRYDF